MAIKKSWTVKGMVFPDCHHRLKQVTVQDDGTLSCILVRYANLAAKQADVAANGLEFQGYNDIPYNKGGTQNPHSVAYAYLNALPEYSGSEVE